MKKWNNVYFYSYDASENVIKNKIINVVEGTEEDHNLSIFPDVFRFYEQHNIVNNLCLDCNEYVHSYNDYYEHLSSTQHKAYCECGECIVQDHNYNSYTQKSDSCHTAMCVCGYEHENQAHFEYRYGYTLFDTKNHNIYCVCGHLVKTEEHSFRFLAGRSCCTLCGYEKKDGFDIMKKEENNIIL